MIYSAKNTLEDTVRLFIAVELPSYIKEEMVCIQKSLIDQSVLVGSYPKPEAMHLTLKFIGDVQWNKISMIQQALRMIKMVPIRADVVKLMFFEHKKFPKVVYIAIDSHEMKELVHAIDAKLKELSATQERYFKPHITLVRVKEMVNYPVFMDWIKNVEVEPLSFTVDSFVLMQSKLNSTGSIHIPIERYTVKS